MHCSSLLELGSDTQRQGGGQDMCAGHEKRKTNAWLVEASLVDGGESSRKWQSTPSSLAERTHLSFGPWGLYLASWTGTDFWPDVPKCHRYSVINRHGTPSSLSGRRMSGIGRPSGAGEGKPGGYVESIPGTNPPTDEDAQAAVFCRCLHIQCVFLQCFRHVETQLHISSAVAQRTGGRP